MRLHPFNRAHALVVTVVLLAIVGVLTGVALMFTTQQARLSRSSTDLSKAILVADSEMERLFDEWRALMLTKPLGAKPTAAELTALGTLPASLANAHPGYSEIPGAFLANFSGTASHTITEVDALGTPVAAGQSGASVQQLPGFKGIFAVNTTYDTRVAVQVDGMGSNNPAVEIVRTFTRTEAPVFQAAIFYEDDIELHPGASMTINGPVISNHRIYARVLAGYDLTFGSIVSANKEPNAIVPGVDYNNRDPSDGAYNQSLPPGSTYGEGAYDDPDFATDQDEQTMLSDRLEPAGKHLRDAFNTGDANTNNDGYRELIEKPDSAHSDPAAIADARFYNQAGLKISVVESGGTQIVTAAHKDGGAVAPGVLTLIHAAIGTRADVYDKREAASVKVTPVDVDKLRLAIDQMNTSGDPAQKFNGVLYLSDDTGGGGRWAFRLENGARLPTYDALPDSPPSERGFTVATAGGIYLRGDYNTDSASEMVPAAIMADAVMFLSNAWNDGNAANPILGADDGAGGIIPGSGRQASETTYRAAIMAGTIPSGYDPDNNSGTSNSYGPGGGAHNFPRLLEKWTGVDMNFKGSMVQTFTSKMFTGQWQTGDVYHPPNRNWSYNENFARHPSPGLFAFTAYHRGPWRRR